MMRGPLWGGLSQDCPSSCLVLTCPTPVRGCGECFEFLGSNRSSGSVANLVVKKPGSLPLSVCPFTWENPYSSLWGRASYSSWGPSNYPWQRAPCLQTDLQVGAELLNVTSYGNISSQTSPLHSNFFVYRYYSLGCHLRQRSANRSQEQPISVSENKVLLEHDHAEAAYTFPSCLVGKLRYVHNPESCLPSFPALEVLPSPMNLSHLESLLECQISQCKEIVPISEFLPIQCYIFTSLIKNRILGVLP